MDEHTKQAPHPTGGKAWSVVAPFVVSSRTGSHALRRHNFNNSTQSKVVKGMESAIHNEAYAVEWSASAQAFHIQPLSETLRIGTISYLEDKPSDYILVAIGRTQNDALKIRLQLEEQKGA